MSALLFLTVSDPFTFKLHSATQGSHICMHAMLDMPYIQAELQPHNTTTDQSALLTLWDLHAHTFPLCHQHSWSTSICPANAIWSFSSMEHGSSCYHWCHPIFHSHDIVPLLIINCRTMPCSWSYLLAYSPQLSCHHLWCASQCSITYFQPFQQPWTLSLFSCIHSCNPHNLMILPFLC